jgi:CO dehydrogenase nickel-insertion accessory protein CooC1
MANSRNGNANSGADLECTTVHLSLQGKGCIGRSLVASLLSQYFKQRKGITVRCIDADPVNQKLAQYKELGAERWTFCERVRLISGHLTACWTAF